MLININTPVSLSIEDLTDLPKLKAFMKHNNIKLNKSELARQLGINRRTVDKYLDGYEQPLGYRNSFLLGFVTKPGFSFQLAFSSD